MSHQVFKLQPVVVACAVVNLEYRQFSDTFSLLQLLPLVGPFKNFNQSAAFFALFSPKVYATVLQRKHIRGCMEKFKFYDTKIRH